MFNLIYCIILIIFTPALLFKSIFSGNFRKLFTQRIRACLIAPTSKQDLIWVHAASVGEVALVKLLHQNWNLNYFITCNTLGGYTEAKKFNSNSFIAPLDFSWSIKMWIQKMRVTGLILIEAEIWYNLIKLISSKHHVSLINGRVSKKNQTGLNKLLYKKLLPSFSLVLAADKDSYNFYRSLKKNEKINYYGNLKFAFNTINLKKKLVGKKTAIKKNYFFVAASLQPEELPIILRAYKKAAKRITNLYLILIPRHPDKQNLFLKQIIQQPVQIITKHQPKLLTEKIIFIPLLGVLNFWYKKADCVFVGGSLCSRGGQNMIEPLSNKVITATGYNTKNFDFAMKLFLAKKTITKINNEQELAEFLINSITKPHLFKNGLIEATKIINKQINSLPLTVNCLKQLY